MSGSNKVSPRSQKFKVLVADDDRQLARSLVTMLQDNNFEAYFCDNGIEAKSVITRWKPRIVLADLMLPDVNALGILKYIKEDPAFAGENIDLCVMSGHNNKENVRQAFKHGAIDYIVKPFKLSDLLGRIVLHCRDHRELTEVDPEKSGPKHNSGAYWLQITQLLLTQAKSSSPIEERLFNLTRMAALMVKGVRCSIVRFIDQNSGVVVTSNDDQSASGIHLNLNKYPEIQLVVNTNQMLAVDNIDADRQLKSIKKNLRSFSFNSIVVCPVHYREETFGVLSMRMPASKKVLTDNEIRFINLVATIASMAINAENEDWIHNQVPSAA